MGPSRIRMGNDEFILYIKKRPNNTHWNNADLGKKIWQWLEGYANGIKLGKKDAMWLFAHDECNEVLKARGLPYSAEQFEFDRSALPALYDYLDKLAGS